MAISTRNLNNDVGTGRATGGVIGLYAALGLGLALMGFAAAFGIGDVPEGADPQAIDAGTAAGSVLSLFVGLLPFIAIPIVATFTGMWAGNATRNGGQGALAGLLGTLVGIFVLLILVGLGIALGAAAAGIGQDVNVAVGDVNVPQGLQDRLAFIGTVAGLTYLIANLLISAIAGAVSGAIMPERHVTPAVEGETTRGPARI